MNRVRVILLPRRREGREDVKTEKMNLDYVFLATIAPGRFNGLFFQHRIRSVQSEE